MEYSDKLTQHVADHIKNDCGVNGLVRNQAGYFIYSSDGDEWFSREERASQKLAQFIESYYGDQWDEYCEDDLMNHLIGEMMSEIKWERISYDIILEVAGVAHE